MQTILGAGGAIGIELAKALTNYTNNIRLVSRNPSKVNETDELFKANLLDKKEVINAVEGAEIVYLTVGLTYDIKVWKSSWPVMVANVISACKHHKAKLVFFDNIYMYDGTNLDPITEDLPINPPSKKGKVRAQIAQMILDAHKNGEIEALIARAADFYGPSVKDVSVLTETVFKPLSKGKKAQWLGSINCKHSYTYTPDAGKATALLGNSPDAYGEVWHLPTAPNPFTGKEWIETIAKEFGAKPNYQVAGKFIVKIMGLFIPIMKELHEMLYQYDRDYVFNSDKFESKFDLKPTPYIQGIREIMNINYSN
ncbi:MAG: NAD-dependent epimerase/dehydratase family protein [Bacteroidales bacterium]|nr:NAD-dependent epimerase/dehydratase family protein [Bacteroidales bacterium]